jgi:hypothetical protein
MMPGTNFCVKCGKNNDESLDSAEIEGEGISENKVKKSINLKVILIPVLIIIVIAIGLTVAMVIPCSPKASLPSGRYEECKQISFSASKSFPFGKDPQIYVSVDGSGYSLYGGQEYYLNQAEIYSYDVYTVNSAGIKSSEKHFEYDMAVPLPHELNVNIAAGTYEDYQDIEILTDDGSTIYFTIDGSEPNENSNVYESAIHLENGKTIIKAFAINSEGTVGDVYKWEYELNLPIPSKVSYSVESGVYYSAFEVELNSDSGATIYYTVDGSEPTTLSNIYSEPLILENGIYEIKAMAVNSYDMPSEMTSCNYVITLPKFAKYPKSAVADKYYGVIGTAGTLTAFDSQMNEEEGYGITGVDSIYSDGNNVYFLMSNALYKLLKGSGSGEKLLDMYVDNFALSNGVIYIESANILYSVDLNGDNLSKCEGMDSCTILGCWDNALYCVNAGNVYRKLSLDSDPELIASVSSSNIFVKDNKIYYIDDKNGISCENIDDGSITKLISATSFFYNLDPAFELINTTDKSETVITSYVDMYVCNNTMYILEKTVEVYTTYHTITQTTDSNSVTYYNWLAVNLDNNNISDTNIKTYNISVFDNVIFDGYGSKNQVVQ